MCGSGREPCVWTDPLASSVTGVFNASRNGSVQMCCVAEISDNLAGNERLIVLIISVLQ